MDLNSGEKKQIASNPDEISLAEIFFILWKQKFIVIVVTTLFGVLSIIFAKMSPVKFTSESKLITKISSSSPTGNLAQMAALAGINVGGTNTSDPTNYLPIIIKDREFIKKTLDKKWYIKGDSLLLTEFWEMKPDTSIENWEYVYETDKLSKLRSDEFINLKIDRRTGLLTLTTEFSDPDLTYQINQYMLYLIDEYIVTKLKVQVKEKRLFIEERIAEIAKDLETSENELAKFKERNLDTDAPKVYLEEQRLLRKVTLNQELYIQLKKQYEIARIEEKNDKPLVEIIQEPEIPLMRSKPNRKLMAMVGTLAGMFVGIFIAFFWNWIFVSFIK